MILTLNLEFRHLPQNSDFNLKGFYFFKILSLNWNSWENSEDKKEFKLLLLSQNYDLNVIMSLEKFRALFKKNVHVSDFISHFSFSLEKFNPDLTCVLVCAKQTRFFYTSQNLENIFLNC